MLAEDPYGLLGVPRDASSERIRRAYELEIMRAHRDGATRHAVDLSAAFDTLSNPARRALYDRHGMSAVRERSPGAAPEPTPWRIVKQQPLPAARGIRRRTHTPWLAIFSLGIAVGLVLAAYLVHQNNMRTGRVGTAPVAPARAEHQVLCQATTAGVGYVYSEPVTSVPRCRNGAKPHVLNP